MLYWSKVSKQRVFDEVKRVWEIGRYMKEKRQRREWGLKRVVMGMMRCKMALSQGGFKMQREKLQIMEGRSKREAGMQVNLVKGFLNTQKINVMRERKINNMQQ